MKELFDFNINVTMLAENYDEAYNHFIDGVDKLNRGDDKKTDFLNGSIRFYLKRAGIHNEAIKQAHYLTTLLKRGIVLKLNCYKIGVLNAETPQYSTFSPNRVSIVKTIRRDTNLSFLFKKKVVVSYLTSLTRYPSTIEGKLIRETDNSIVIEYNRNYEKREKRILKSQIDAIENTKFSQKFIIYIPSGYSRKYVNNIKYEEKIAEEYPENPDYIYLVLNDKNTKMNYIEKIYTGSSDASLDNIDEELSREILKEE